MNLEELERYRRAIRDLRAQSRLETRRRELQGIVAPAVTLAGIGDKEWAYQYLVVGCHVGDLVVCASRGMADEIENVCGFAVSVLAFNEVEGAVLPRRMLSGAPRTVFVIGLQQEAAQGRGCPRAAIERIDADEFVYLD